ncbi:MAG: DUF1273 family protein [Clostridia bacterium]|nr:DUF1273 family protein [Clostridia bacterium]
MEGVDVFLFGSKSKFVDLCYKIATDLQKDYPHIKRISFPTKGEFVCTVQEKIEFEKRIKSFFNVDLINDFEEIDYNVQNHLYGVASYVQRNKYMIDKSDICVFFYDENYQAVKEGKGGMIRPRNSGTKIALDYAERKGKKLYIINNQHNNQQLKIL